MKNESILISVEIGLNIALTMWHSNNGWVIDSCQSNDNDEHLDETTWENISVHVIYYLKRRSRAKQISNSIMTRVNVIWGRLLSVLMNNGNTHDLLIQLFQDYTKTSKHGDNNKTPSCHTHLRISADLTWFMSVSKTCPQVSLHYRRHLWAVMS